MTYNPINFNNGQAGGTPVSASNLRHVENGIVSAHNDIATLTANVNSLSERYGTPLVASTAAGMTDTTKIYVYVGSETGYTTGNWYYYDGDSWESGGAYNSTAVNTDKTLTQEDMAADSKKVGDEISDLKNALNLANENILNVIDIGDYLSASSAYKKGSYNLQTGEFQASNIACVDSDQKKFELLSDDVTIKVAEGMHVRGIIYDASGIYNTYFNWLTGETKFAALQNKKGYYIKPILAKEDNSAITDTDLQSYNASTLQIITPIESAVADKYNTAQTYNKGNLCQYNGALYRCTDDGVTGAWNELKWAKTTVADELAINPSVAAIRDTMYTYSANVLDPDTLTDSGYYYDYSDGTTQISNSGAGTKITADIINTGLIPSLHIRQTFDDTSTARIFIYFYAGDVYLGYRMVRFSEIGNKDYEMATFAGADGIRVYVNSKNVLGSQICISLSLLSAFSPFEMVYHIKPDQLNSKLKGKIIANFGDSIFGNKRPPNDVSTEIARITGATVYNLGFGGCRMAKASANWNPFSMYSLAYAIANNDFSAQDAIDIDAVGLPSYFKETRTLLESIDFNDVDIVTISYGTNDFASSVTLDDESNPLNTNTFAGALRYSLETLWSAYPHLKIFVCTPTYRFWMDENNQFLYDSNTHEIGGQLLTQFVEKVFEISKDYQITAIDNYFELGINQYNRSAWFPATDGTHQNFDGAKLIAQHMSNELY